MREVDSEIRIPLSLLKELAAALLICGNPKPIRKGNRGIFEWGKA